MTPAHLSALTPDQRYVFEERAAIYEFEAGFTRRAAEIKAWEELKRLCVLPVLDVGKYPVRRLWGTESNSL